MIQVSRDPNMKLDGGVLAVQWRETWFLAARSLRVRVVGALNWNFAGMITMIQGSRGPNMKLNGGVLAVQWRETWFGCAEPWGPCSRSLKLKFCRHDYNDTRITGSEYEVKRRCFGCSVLQSMGFSIFGLCAWGLNQKVDLYPPWDIDNDNWCLYTP